MLRSILFFTLSALSACTTAATVPSANQFVLADTAKYKTGAEKERARELAQTDCKAKALTAGAALEKTIASERNSIENISRAREKSAEMYATSFDLCMINAGYVKK